MGRLALAAALVLLLTADARADLGAGISAYKRGDYATALAEFRRAAEQGSVVAQVNLAAMYYKGQGVPQDDAEAATWYRKAADQGDAVAQNNIGLMYDNGRGVPQDYGAAVTWYRRAAEQGQTGAQFNLGVMYRNGLGVGQDPAEAALWFQRAAEAGLAEAQYTMGRMRHLGVVLVRDHRRALKLVPQGRGPGSPESQEPRESAGRGRRDAAAAPARSGVGAGPWRARVPRGNKGGVPPATSCGGRRRWSPCTRAARSGRLPHPAWVAGLRHRGRGRVAAAQDPPSGPA